MNYFRLFPDCIFSKGETLGIVLLLTSNKIFHLNEEETLILEKLLSNMSISNVQKEFSNTESFINKMINLNLGTLYNTPVFRDVYKPKCNWEMRGFLEEVPKFNNIFFVLDSKCKLDCGLCSNDRIIKNGCKTCAYSYNVSSKDNKYKHINIIREILKLNIDKITLVTKNLENSWTEIIELVKVIQEHNKNVRIVINTNEYELNQEKLNEVYEFDITLCITVLDYIKIYGDKNGKNLENKMYKNIKNILDIGISLEICVLVDRKNDKLLHKYNTILPNKIEIAESYKLINNQINQYYCKSIEKKLDFNADKYFRNTKYNSCLFGKLTFTPNGDISVCPVSNRIIGTYKEGWKTPFRNGKIDELWRKTKNHVSKCKSCEYKYICEDCSILELAVDNNKLSDKLLCNYNPSTGKWDD